MLGAGADSQVWPTPLADARPRPAAPLVLAFAIGMAAMLPLFLFFATERFSVLARLLAWLGLLYQGWAIRGLSHRQQPARWRLLSLGPSS